MTDTGRAKCRVLVIDDDTSMRELVGLHLRNAGFEVVVAKDAVEGGYMLLQSPPDLLIVDVDMPYMSGYEFVTALKGDQATQAIPVIFMTADDDVKAKSRQLGGAGYLRKPLTSEALISTVRRAAESLGCG